MANKDSRQKTGIAEPDRMQETSREELHSVTVEQGQRINELVRANSDLRNLFESTEIATLFLDKQLRVRSFTPFAADIFDVQEQDLGRSIDDLKLRVCYPELGDDVRQVLGKLATLEREIASHSGAYRARIHPYRSVDDRIAGVVLTFVDVTRTARAEAALRARLRILVAELQHRVRKSLALVKSITARTAESSETVEEMTAHLLGRIEAFARVQSMVTRNPDRGVDLSALVGEEMLAHAVHEGEQLTINGTDVALKPKAAETISLALHELATNAVKHGSLAKGKGRVAVGWRKTGSGKSRKLRFTWSEDRMPRERALPAHDGFGMELLTRILPYDLDAKTSLEFRQEGLRFQMELPSRHLASRDEMLTP